MSKRYKGLYTFDMEAHKFIDVGSAEGIVDCIGCGLPAESTEGGKKMDAVIGLLAIIAEKAASLRYLYLGGFENNAASVEYRKTVKQINNLVKSALGEEEE